MEISLFFPSGGLRSKVEPSKKPLHTSQGRFFLRKIHSTPPKPPTLRPIPFLTGTHRLSSAALTPYIVNAHHLSPVTLCTWMTRPDFPLRFPLPCLSCLSAQLWLLLYTHWVPNTRFRGRQRFSPTAKRFIHRAFHLRKLNPLVKYEEGTMCPCLLQPHETC